jgi:hypothetical protein
MHCPTPGVAEPKLQQLHPELLQHLPALRSIAQVLDDHDQNIEPLLECMDLTQLSALKFLEQYTLRPGVYGVPFLHPDYCDQLIAEANIMADTVGYEPNENEDEAYQIPELYLRDVCPELFASLTALFDTVFGIYCRLLFGTAPTFLNSAQFARYKPDGRDAGNWHHDQDSDITAVVSLAPEHFTGGGTDLRTAPTKYNWIPPLPKGHALLFTGRTTLHRGRAVETGVRDLLVFWSTVHDKE